MDSEITIRIAGPDNWQAIIDIYNQGIDDGCNAFTHHISIESQRKWLEIHDGVNYAIFIAEIGKTVAGWLSLGPYRAEREAFRKAGETSYYIDRQYRNMGVGIKLMEHALKRAPDYGLEIIMAFLLDINSLSVRLLEKNGFRRWGHFPGIAEIGNDGCGQYVYGINLKNLYSSSHFEQP